MNSPFALITGLAAAVAAAGLLASCQTLPRVPPPVPARVDSVQVTTGEFQGRIEAYADIAGHLSGGAAQLVEPRQWREGYRLYVEILEQTPPQAAGTTALVPFQRRVPLEIAGLAPGVYIVNVNGLETHLEIDGTGLRPAVSSGQFL